MKQVSIGFGRPDCPKLHLLVISPKYRGDRHAPAVFLGLNFSGNHTVLPDARIALPTVWMPDGPGVKEHRATEEGAAPRIKTWEIEHVVDHGYAVATFLLWRHRARQAGLDEGVFPFFRMPGQTKPRSFDWASIAAWAWGARHAVDYLVTDGDVDGKRIIVFGHSRLGKRPSWPGRSTIGSRR